MPTLDWIGKAAVVNHHREVPTRLLHCDPALSFGKADAGNLLVQGDNLEALKALLPYYAGKVKCIYIDPPYNTGNEGWIYNDNVNSPEIKAWLGLVVGKEAEDLSRHDKWLSMMYPRLRLLRDFLTPDGSIWISIDDNEAHSLRTLLDEIFGRNNFVASVAWQKRYSRENRGAIGDAHEYVLVYAADPDIFKISRNLIPISASQAKIYRNPDDPQETDATKRWRGLPMTAQGFRPNQMYEIVAPNGTRHRPPEGRCWSMLEGEFEKLRAIDRIHWGKSGDAQPSVVRYLSEVEGITPWTWWPHEEVGHTDEAKKEIREIFGTQTAFDTPKPTRLLERIVRIATKPGDIVLDSFAGSGTTGHATFRVAIEDSAKQEARKFVLIEMDSTIATTVTSKRIGHAFAGSENIQSGLRFCTLGKPLFDEWGGVNDGVTFSDLAAFVFFSDTGSPIPAKATAATSLLGTFQDRAIHLLFAPEPVGLAIEGSGTVLTLGALEALPPHNGPRVVYAEGCTVPAERLAAAGVVFKQVPYQLQAT